MTTNSFSYTPTKIMMIISALVAILGMSLLLIFGLNPNRPHEGQAGSTVYPPTLAALATGCGDYFRWDTEPGKHYAYITDTEKAKLRVLPQPLMNVPAYGYMGELPLAESDTNKFLTPEDLNNEEIPMTTILRTLFDYDVTIIWYDPTVEAVVIDVRAYVNETEGVMGIPWLFENRRIPLNRSVAFSHWGTTQSCHNFSVRTANDFLEFVERRPVEHSAPAPHAEISEDGAQVPMLYIGPYEPQEYIERFND